MSMLSFVAAASGGGALVRLGAARAPARLGRPGPPRNAVVASGGGGLLGRLLTAMSGSGGAAASSSASVAVPSPASVPSWADLEGTLPADAMEPDYVNGVARASPSWEDESVRLFGKDRKDVRLVLYRDKAYWCPYCQRVSMQLELKRIPHIIRKINMRCYGPKPAYFMKMVPSGLLPVIELDGAQPLTESMDIMFELERAFPDSPSLIPSTDTERMQSFHQLLRLERILAGAWLNWLRGPLRSSGSAESSFLYTVEAVDQALRAYGDGPFFLGGDTPSFVDCVFAPFLERIRSSVAYWRSVDILDVERWPSLAAWFAAMEAFPLWANCRSDDLTHVLALPPQIGPCTFVGDRRRVSLAIDRARSLAVLNDGDDAAATALRAEAAAALVNNREAVVKDALKGIGKAGSAPAVDTAVAVGFRAAAAVLADPTRLEALEADLAAPATLGGHAAAVAAAARYERQRACVPRDMTAAGAVQFCGAMNWLEIGRAHV